MRRLADRATALLRWLLDAAAAGLLAAVLIIVSAQVVARYFFNFPMPWSEELTRLLFVWLVMIGAARAAHMRIDLLPAALPPVPRRVLELATAGLALALLAIMVRHAVGMVELTAYDRYTALGISVQYLYWAAIVGGCLWMVMIVAGLLLGQDEARP